MSMTWGSAAGILVGVLVFGCAGGDVFPDEDAGPDATADAHPEDAATVDGAPPDVGGGRAEVCGNGVDDDADGRIDNGCACAVGTVRPCWLGPPSAVGVGQCLAGQQACEPEGEEGVWGFCVDQTLPERELSANGRDEDCDGLVDESDARCQATEQREMACDDGLDGDCDGLSDCEDPDCLAAGGCTMTCADRETVCWGGADEDCDAVADCDDPDCASSDACAESPCPDGQTPIYTERPPLSPIVGPPQVEMGDGDPVMPMTCGESPCADGQVEVRPNEGGFVCAPPPPPCPEGQTPTYETGGRWRCDPPCTHIIRYGYLYGFRRVCAGPPDVVCTGTDVPTFHAEEQRWVCAPICDNTLYDRIFYEGQLVCLPC